MGVSKPNSRSFRYSNAVAQALDAAPGDNASDKFNNLVLLSVEQLPFVQRRLREADAELSQLLEQRKRLHTQVCDLQALLYQQNAFYHHMLDFSHALDLAGGDLRDHAVHRNAGER